MNMVNVMYRKGEVPIYIIIKQVAAVKSESDIKKEYSLLETKSESWI